VTGLPRHHVRATPATAMSCIREFARHGRILVPMLRHYDARAAAQKGCPMLLAKLSPAHTAGGRHVLAATGLAYTHRHWRSMRSKSRAVDLRG
jgi:hypothetical protein